jgi:hypothetical protein
VLGLGYVEMRFVEDPSRLASAATSFAVKVTRGVLGIARAPVSRGSRRRHSLGWLIASMQTVTASTSASSSPSAISTPYVSRTRNQRFETLATVSPSRVISYSWSTRLPFASRSDPPSTSIENRSRMPMSAFLTVATDRPPRSISILSRTLSLRS